MFVHEGRAVSIPSARNRSVSRLVVAPAEQPHCTIDSLPLQPRNATSLHAFKKQLVGFLNAKKQPLRIHEDILVFYRKQATYNPQRRPGKPYTNVKRHYGSTNYGKVRPEHVTKCDGGRYPISILNFKRDKEKLHPTQKPVALCEYLVSTYTNPGDLVFDPTAGVASTCVAAENLGRRWIGCELSADYWAKGKERF